jgi:hypothetical protein
MDDALKAAGVVTGGGFSVAIVMLAYRVYNDPALTYFVVGGGMVIFGGMVACLGFLLLRHALEARRLQLDASLTSARIMRTLDGVSRPQLANGNGGDVLTQLIAAAGGGAGDVVDGTVTYPAALPDHDDD